MAFNFIIFLIGAWPENQEFITRAHFIRSSFGEITAHIYLGRGKTKKSIKKIVSKYKSRHHFKLYAYYIMDKHAHLLIEVCDIP